MSVPRWYIDTGTFENCYLGFHTYASLYVMYSCMIEHGDHLVIANTYYYTGKKTL